jgi:hypothetical protein
MTDGQPDPSDEDLDAAVARLSSQARLVSAITAGSAPATRTTQPGPRTKSFPGSDS